MNKQNRETIAKLQTKLEEIKGELEDLQSQESDKFDNLSEGLQSSEKGEALQEAWEQLQVGGGVARAVAVKPGVTVFDISGIADLGGFAVRDDANPRIHLFLNGFRDGPRHGRVKVSL